MRKTNLFLVAVIYGAAWFVGPLNLLAAVQALQGGDNASAYLPMILLPFGIILYVHHMAGWFPFRRRV